MGNTRKMVADAPQPPGLIIIGHRLAVARRARGLNRRALAAAARRGWTARSLASLEQGQQDVGIIRLWALSDALQLPLVELLDGL